MEENSEKLTELSSRKKIVVITRMFFCSEHIKAYCESLGLRREEISVDNLTTIAGGDVVDALIEGLEEGLAKGVRKITNQRLAAADKITDWVKGDAE